ncbi:hypothetical protein ACE6H2_010357 [Prunus campanulata]
MDPNGGSSSPEDIFNSTVNKMVAASVVSGVVYIVAVAAIIYAIINCVKKAGSTIPMYTRIVDSVDSTGKDSNQVAIDIRADQFPQSPPRNLSQCSGTDEDSNTSASSTKASEINETELAAVE